MWRDVATNWKCGGEATLWTEEAGGKDTPGQARRGGGRAARSPCRIPNPRHRGKTSVPAGFLLQTRLDVNRSSPARTTSGRGRAQAGSSLLRAGLHPSFTRPRGDGAPPAHPATLCAHGTRAATRGRWRPPPASAQSPENKGSSGDLGLSHLEPPAPGAAGRAPRRHPAPAKELILVQRRS